MSGHSNDMEIDEPISKRTRSPSPARSSKYQRTLSPSRGKRTRSPSPARSSKYQRITKKRSHSRSPARSSKRNKY